MFDYDGNIQESLDEQLDIAEKLVESLKRQRSEVIESIKKQINPNYHPHAELIYNYWLGKKMSSWAIDRPRVRRNNTNDYTCYIVYNEMFERHGRTPPIWIIREDGDFDRFYSKAAWVKHIGDGYTGSLLHFEQSILDIPDLLNLNDRKWVRLNCPELGVDQYWFIILPENA